MKIPYIYHGEKKSVSPHDLIRLSGAELQAVIVAASLLGLTGMIPAWLVLRGGRI